MQNQLLKIILIIALLALLLSIPLLIEKSSNRERRGAPQITESAANSYGFKVKKDDENDNRSSDNLYKIGFYTILMLATVSVFYFIGFKIIKDKNEQAKK